MNDTNNTLKKYIADIGFDVSKMELSLDQRKTDLERIKKAQERLARLGKPKNIPQIQRIDSDYIIDNVIQASVKVGKL